MIPKWQVKYIQSLGQKKLRNEGNVFVAEGPKIINELLQEGRVEVDQLFATSAWINLHAAHFHSLTNKLTEITEAELQRLSFLQTPNEILGVFKQPKIITADLTRAVSLMLDGIQDPGNMGTLIRIADWFGITQVICSQDCADAYAPKVVQGSMGSVARVSTIYTDLRDLAANSPDASLYAATLQGEPITGMQPISNGVIVIGNESKGISAALLACCNHQVTIPRIGEAESLNAGVATGIILSHLLRS